ncbi:protein of unknown function [Candidatus Filomicrobium marinum]|nr:protein of unknown function [Candidatus Filomicrobium marinum]
MSAVQKQLRFIDQIPSLSARGPVTGIVTPVEPPCRDLLKFNAAFGAGVSVEISSSYA